MNEAPRIEVEATFLPAEEGGRKVMPVAGRSMPHLVVQPPEVRAALMDGNRLVEDYLGVNFVVGPEVVVAGQPGRFVVELMYHPEVNYEPLGPGATFTIREGGRVVGHGRVIRR